MFLAGILDDVGAWHGCKCLPSPPNAGGASKNWEFFVEGAFNKNCNILGYIELESFV